MNYRKVALVLLLVLTGLLSVVLLLAYSAYSQYSQYVEARNKPSDTFRHGHGVQQDSPQEKAARERAEQIAAARAKALQQRMADAAEEKAELERAAHKAERQAAAWARAHAEEKKEGHILYKETTKNRNYSCEYYARRGQYYAYENTLNDIYFFKPVIDSKRYIIAEKPSNTSLGGMNSINTQRIISCRKSCRILKIQRSENNTFSLAGFIFPSTNSHYKAMSTKTIYGAAMEDLRNGCMAASIKKQLAEQQAAARAEQTSKNQQMIGMLINTIKIQTAKDWVPVAHSAFSCEIQIRLGPHGQLLGTPVVIRSSGDAHFDHLVVAAVEAAAPFVPPVGLPYSAFNTPIDLKMSAWDLNHGV